KARIKILVDALGIETFKEKVEAEWKALIDGNRQIDLPLEEVERIHSYFQPPAFAPLSEQDQGVDLLSKTSPAFAAWMKANVVQHKRDGYRIVNISLKRPDIPPGDISADEMEAVADLADAYSFSEIRASHEQNLVLPHVPLTDLPEVWRGLQRAGLAEANIDLATDIIACPGLDYCSLANARSIPIAQSIADSVRAVGDEAELGHVEIKISGCINACGHHHVGHIGILGVDKKGEEFYQILLGGSASENASIGKIMGKALPADDTVKAVRRVLDLYKEKRVDGEKFIDAYSRLGPDVFKEAIHAAA
ncbi:MAG: nitrite/sulfite reductase, partial [Pseudomonadota bacterium]